jgi:DNA modification methylase
VTTHSASHVQARGGVVAGCCLDVLRSMPAERVDLIVTSPPYADQRASTYGGVTPDDYVEWFMPRAEQFARELKREGSPAINIKEKVVDGERRLHFTRQKRFKMNQDAVMVPMGDWARTRLKTLGANDVVRHDSRVGNAFGRNIANWQGRDRAYPTNVLRLATECGNKGHGAGFPQALPRWFIEPSADPGDTVPDPFDGSGTTLAAALAPGRNAIGVELAPAYVTRVRDAVASAHEAAQALARASVVSEQEIISPGHGDAVATVSKDSVPS